MSAAELTRPKLTQGGGSTDRGIVTAGADGARYQLPGGTVLDFAPGTSFKLFGASQDLMLRPGSKLPTWSVYLRSGRLDVSVPAGPRPNAVLVTTTKKSGGIALGGRMTVLADAAGVLVVNRSGEALAGVTDRWKPLGAGMQRAFTNADASGTAAPTPMVATPVLAAQPPIRFAFQGRVALPPVTWAPSAGAASYLVELEDAAGTVQRRQTTQARLDQTFDPLPPGSYSVHVTAYDARGIESGRSAPLRVRVVGVELPAGAYIDDGAVQLAPGQQVKLSGVAGLQMSYTGKGDFAPAASAFGVFRDEPRTVWLRAEGSREMQQLRLAPRRLSAQIELGPKRAIWPRDTVTVSIRLKDGSGKPLPSWLKATPNVSIGLTPVDVSWQAVQGTLQATVPVPETRGPWVVRVEVLDQYRIPLGYEFLEVAEVRNRSAAHPASTP